MPGFKHKAWHVLFDNYDVLKVFDLFQEYYDVFGKDENKSAAQYRRNKEWVDERPTWVRRRNAWWTLFRNMDLEETIKQINSIWIDPDYKLVIVTEEVKKVAMGSTQ